MRRIVVRDEAMILQRIDERLEASDEVVRVQRTNPETGHFEFGMSRRARLAYARGRLRFHDEHRPMSGEPLMVNPMLAYVLIETRTGFSQGQCDHGQSSWCAWQKSRAPCASVA